MDRNNTVMDIGLDGVLVDMILGERIEFLPFLNAGSSSTDQNLPGPEWLCGIQARPKLSFERLVKVLACKICQNKIK